MMLQLMEIKKKGIIFPQLRSLSDFHINLMKILFIEKFFLVTGLVFLKQLLH